jgi:hypothetical protein
MNRRQPGRERSNTNALRFLNQPRPIEVLTEHPTDHRGPIPVAVLQDGRARAVERLEDTWLLEDEWWRQRICRRYYRLALVDGVRLTVFHDCAVDAWYAQGY